MRLLPFSLASLASLVLGVFAIGCSSADEGSAEEGAADEAALESVGPDRDDDVGQAQWQTLGLGVSYKTVGSGTNALIVYGGYSAQDVYSQRWAQELFRARRDSLSFGHIYAIRGPNQSLYQNREIQNSRLAAHLAANVTANASSLVIVAHSSGTFVSTELLQMMAAGRAGPADATLGKVSIFHLDGGGTPGRGVLAKTKGAYFVYACDRNLGQCSQNASSMKWLGQTYADLGGAIKIDATGSGCASGAGWCLHDTVVTTRPHNPQRFDLRRDYTAFGGARRVVDSYLDSVQ